MGQFGEYWKPRLQQQVQELQVELEPEPEPELEPGLEVPGPEGLLLYPHPSILHNYGLPIPCCLRHHFHTFCGLC